MFSDFTLTHFWVIPSCSTMPHGTYLKSNWRDKDVAKPYDTSSSIPSTFVLRMGGEKDWEVGIMEILRIDRGLLALLPATAFSEVEIWERFLDLNYTRHAQRRLETYVDQWSDRPWIDGEHYMEMYASEYEFLKNPSKLEPLLPYAKRVEIGINKNGKVCKISYVLDLTTHCPHLYKKMPQNGKSRWLFICVGVDGFIKTINITPGEKERTSYGGHVKYMDFHGLMQTVC